jgi:cytochrome c oxidase cbb3-type subunit 3
MLQISKRFILPAFALFTANVAMAAGDAAPAAAAGSAEFTMSVNDVLTACAALLLLIIFALGYTLRSSVLYYHNRRQKESQSTSGKAAAILLLLLMGSLPVWAQGSADAAAAAPTEFRDSEMLRWILYTVLGLELIIIFQFTKMIRFFTGVEAFTREQKKAGTSKSFSIARFWDKINRFRPIEEEAGIDTGHSYDGIRELNNVTPPWFIAGFALTIAVAFIYMWRYHVAETAPLQIEEYNIAVAEAKAEHEAFLKTQANNVDENSVALLDAGGIAAGQALFASNCVACHGDKGQGAVVGPNLSDNYWLHKGGIKDIFKTIKYGWQEKGMKSWKDDFSPNQIAQLASYVYSLRGTNPPGAKEPQGELYQEDAAAATAPATDSVKATAN